MGRTEIEKNTILSTAFPECNPRCISEYYPLWMKLSVKRDSFTPESHRFSALKILPEHEHLYII